MKKELIDLFGLEGLTEESSDTEILDAIKKQVELLKQSENQAKKQVENSVKDIVKQHVQQGRIPQNMVKTYETIGITSGLDALTSVLGSIQPKMRLVDMIKTEGKSGVEGQKDKSKWDLDDYRMYAPNELRDNQNLYNELFEKKYVTK